MSMLSSIICIRARIRGYFYNRAMGEPVGVPHPFVKITMVAPPASIPVMDSMS